ncbi:hypothetical protein ES702_01066 [subsurface metagenome]
MVIEMYEPKKEYKGKDEIKDHLPEWIRILQDYFRKGYYSPLAKRTTKESNK